MAKNKILEDQLKETFLLLDQYKGNEIDDSVGENLILLIGVTGSGKSTVAQFLNNNENLKSVKRNGAFLFVDGNKIGDSTTISKTLIPELIPVKGTNFVLADCPGFSDTRSASHDIAATIFTNRLLKQVKNIKIAIVISHHAVIEGIDRSAFTNTLGHIVEFIKNIPKYQQSIGLIISKVDNQYQTTQNEDDDGNIIYTLIPDSEMNEDIVGFLQIVKNELEMDEDIQRQQKKTELIDILLSKTSQNSSKIEIFRKPRKSGLVSENKLFQKEKTAMRKLLFEELIYTTANETDFGLSISADSKVVALEMTNSVDQQLRLAFKQVCDSVLFEFKAITGTTTTKQNQNNIKEAINKFLNIHGMMKSLNNNGNDFRITDFIIKLNTSKFIINNEILANLEKQQTYLNFLESVSVEALNFTVAGEFQTFLEQFDRAIVDVTSQIHEVFDTHIIEDFKEIRNRLLNEFENIIDIDFNKSVEAFGRFSSMRQKLELFQDESVKFSIVPFINSLRNSNFQISDGVLQDMKQQEEYLTFLQNLSKNATSSEMPKEFRGFYKQFLTSEITMAMKINNMINSKIDENIKVALTVFFDKSNDAVENTTNFDDTNFVLKKLINFDEMVQTSKKYQSLSVKNFMQEMNNNIDYVSLSDIQQNLHHQQKFYATLFNTTELSSVLVDSPSEWSRLSKIISLFETNIQQQITASTDKMQNFANQELKRLFRNISDKIVEAYVNIVADTDDYTTLNSLLHETNESTKQLNKYITDEKNSFEESIKMVHQQWLPKIKIVIPNIESNLQNLKKSLSVLQKVGKISGFEEHSKMIIEQLAPATKKLSVFDEWYQFIVDFADHLSHYKMQKNVDSKMISDLKDWKKVQQDVPSIISKNNLYSKTELSDVEQNSLNEILLAVSPDNTKHICEGNNDLYISGKFLKLSEIKNSPDECKQAKNIFVLSTNTLFIDVDLNFKGEKKSLYIISPKWEVIDKRRIVLDGENGTPHYRHQAQMNEPGLDGNYGSAGGNFFGIGLAFIKGVSLTITANGGSGSSGQDGGDGSNGKFAGNPEIPDDSSVRHIHENYHCADFFNEKSKTFEKLEEVNHKFSSDLWGDADGKVGLVINKLKWRYILYGKKSERGKDGGVGGSSSLGGDNGNIKLHEMDVHVPSNINQMNEQGNDGAAGNGGKEGDGEENGANVRVTCVKYVSGVWPLLFKKHSAENATWNDAGFAPNGKTGKNGQIGTKLKDKSPSYTPQKAVDYFQKKANEEKPNKITDKVKKEFMVTLNNFGKFSRKKRSITTNTLPKRNYFVSNETLTSKTTNNIIDQRPQIETENNSNGNGSLISFNNGGSNSTLLLIDLLMRKLTKSKPITSYYTSTDQMAAQAEALKIVEACEHYLDALMEQTGQQFWEYDFPLLQQKVMQQIMQANNENMEPIKAWALQEIHDFHANHLFENEK